MKKILYVLFAFLAILVVVPPLAVVADSGAIWTRYDCGNPQDANHYDPGQTVIVVGANFAPNTEFGFTVIGKPGGASSHPGQTVSAGSITSSSDGSFCFGAHTVGDGEWGEFSVNVGGKNDNYRVKRAVVVPPPPSTPKPTATPKPTLTPTEPIPTEPIPTEPTQTDEPTPPVTITPRPPTSTQGPPTETPVVTPVLPTPVSTQNPEPTPTAENTPDPTPVYVIERTPVKVVEQRCWGSDLLIVTFYEYDEKGELLSVDVGQLNLDGTYKLWTDSLAGTFVNAVMDYRTCRVLVEGTLEDQTHSDIYELIFWAKEPYLVNMTNTDTVSDSHPTWVNSWSFAWSADGNLMKKNARPEAEAVDLHVRCTDPVALYEKSRIACSLDEVGTLAIVSARGSEHGYKEFGEVVLSGINWDPSGRYIYGYSGHEKALSAYDLREDKVTPLYAEGIELAMHPDRTRFVWIDAGMEDVYREFNSTPSGLRTPGTPFYSDDLLQISDPYWWSMKVVPNAFFLYDFSK